MSRAAVDRQSCDEFAKLNLNYVGSRERCIVSFSDGARRSRIQTLRFPALRCAARTRPNPGADEAIRASRSSLGCRYALLALGLATLGCANVPIGSPEAVAATTTGGDVLVKGYVDPFAVERAPD
jgi:hypothetical protein